MGELLECELKPIYQITMKLRPLAVSPVIQLIVRVEGLPRNEAILLAEEIAGSNYEVYFVIAGPRNEVNS